MGRSTAGTAATGICLLETLEPRLLLSCTPQWPAEEPPPPPVADVTAATLLASEPPGAGVGLMDATALQQGSSAHSQQAALPQAEAEQVTEMASAQPPVAQVSAAFADLGMEVARARLPEMLFSDRPLRGTVVVTVHNYANARVAPGQRVTLTLFAYPSAGGEPILLSQRDVNLGKLAAGGSRRVTTKVNAAAVPPGNYNIRAVLTPSAQEGDTGSLPSRMRWVSQLRVATRLAPPATHLGETGPMLGNQPLRTNNTVQADGSHWYSYQVHRIAGVRALPYTCKWHSKIEGPWLKTWCTRGPGRPGKPAKNRSRLTVSQASADADGAWLAVYRQTDDGYRRVYMKKIPPGRNVKTQFVGKAGVRYYIAVTPIAETATSYSMSLDYRAIE